MKDIYTYNMDFKGRFLPDKSSIFSAELHALYLALDRVETADDDERNFIIFSDSKSALQAILGTGHILLSSTYWNASIG